MSVESRRSRFLGLALVAWGLALGAALPVQGEEAPAFPEVTSEERALTTVPGAPDARAVYLFREGRVKLAFNLEDGVRARVEVAARLKILTEQGKDLAQLVIYHGRYVQLEQLTARTVSPDGTVTVVPDSAMFRQRLSDRERYYSTRLAFPKVKVGSILDFRYELDMEDILFLEPWVFHQALPALRSAVVFAVPEKIRPREVLFNPLRFPIEATQVAADKTAEWRFAARNLPALVEEPFGVPHADLASSVLLVPAAVTARGSRVGYEDGWERVLRALAQSYDQSLPAERVLKRRVDELLRGLPAADAAARARRLFHYVRDEIGQAPGGGVFLERGTKLQRVIESDAGSAVEKAVLLDALLAAAGFDRWLQVASPLDAGTLKTDIAAFWQLERVLVAASVQGEVVHLDPGNPCLGFGHLAPPYQGSSALLVRSEKPTKLPVHPAADSSRSATLELQLDPGGRLSGSGTAELRGLHAYRLCQRLEDADEPEAELKRWLEEELGNFRVSDIQYTPAGTGDKARLSWRMEQREEAVLGDEASFEPSRPWGPSRQRLVQPPEERRSDVRLPFAGSEEVSVVLTWPDSWEVEAVPEDLALSNLVGEVQASGQVDRAARQLRYGRRVVLQDARLGSKIEYTAGRKLFADLEAHDAQAIVLVRR